MEYVEVQGEQIPSLGLGTWQMTGHECREAVKGALEIGYRHIDTAQAYQNEQDVGTAIRNSEVDRDEIWLTTKIWRTNFGHDDVIASFEESLNRLQTDYVDLLLIHWPSETAFNETLDAMNKLVDSGRVRNIGVSNFTTDHIDRAWSTSDRPLLTDQVEYHPLLNQDAVLEKCREREMMLTAYSPLTRGDLLRNETLQEIGERYGKGEAQVALRWLIQQENVAAIPKSSTQEHQQANIKIFDFELSGDEMQQIHELTSTNSRKIDPGFAPYWD